MKLSICVPQYNENRQVIQPLLDSIAIQLGIDLHDVEVVIVNDGSNTLLDKTWLNTYLFKVRYILADHHGVSAARNRAMKEARGDYVCFCDADDRFASTMALWCVWSEMEKHFEMLTAAFYEEFDIGGKTRYQVHERDTVFVHGKFFRRKFLLDNDISFNESINVHEDHLFCETARNCCTKDVRYCPKAIYVWCNNRQSVCRKERDYLVKTYPILNVANYALVREMEKRKKPSAAYYAVNALLESYFMLYNLENMGGKPDDIERVWRSTAMLYANTRKYWKQVPDDKKQDVLRGVHDRMAPDGTSYPEETIDQYFDRLERILLDHTE